jgi:hypothetical protein
MGYFDNNGIFLGAAPARPVIGKDLGEYGSSGRTGSGYSPGNGNQVLPGNAVLGNYWARANGVIFPSTPGDIVAIGQFESSYGAKLSVGGSIYALGYLLSDRVFITKDAGDNLVFTDPIAGSKTLIDLLTMGGGDVHASGTPALNELAQWVSGHYIKGLAISALTLTQSQVTGLVTALAGKASKIHNLVDTVNHPVSGLTPGHVLTALTPTSYGFAAPMTATSLWKQLGGVLSPLDVDVNTIKRDDGSAKHLQIIAGNSDAIGNYAGDLILRAGDPYAGAGYPNKSGHLQLIPGSGAGWYGQILLGDAAKAQPAVWIAAQGTASDIGIFLTAKGNGQMQFNAGTVQINGIYGTQIGDKSLALGLSNDIATYTFPIQPIPLINNNGISVSLVGGEPITTGGTAYNGGDVYIYGGLPRNAGTVGNIFLGTGSAGTHPLPAAGINDTYMLTYNPTTGQISIMLI